MTTASSIGPDFTRPPGPIDRLVSWLFTGIPGPGVVALCGLASFLALLNLHSLFNDGDTFWHLATGEWILRHGAVPTTDPFSYTYAGGPWQAHEWLAQVAMVLAYRAGSWSGLAVLFAAAFGATAALLAAYLKTWLRVGPLLVAVLFALACGAPSLLARPHLLAQPLLVIWVFGLLAARRRGLSPPWTLLPLMLVWSNLHGSFVLGLALIGPFALEALVAGRERPWPVIRTWGAFGVAALGLSLINPQGLHGLTYPFKVSGMTSLPIIMEWRSADFSKLSLFEIGLLEALFICLWRGVKVPAIRLLVLLGLLHLAFQHVRHQATFALLAVMLLAEPLARARPASEPSSPALRPATGQTRAVFAAALAVALLAAGWLRLAVPMTRADGVNAPMSALAAVPAEVVRMPVFNEYGFGGYLIFKGVRPYIDGRGDMYGDQIMHTYGAMVRPDLATLKSELATRHIAWTILARDNPAVGALDSLPGWRRLYADRIAVVHVRQDATNSE